MEMLMSYFHVILTSVFGVASSFVYFSVNKKGQGDLRLLTQITLHNTIGEKFSTSLCFKLRKEKSLEFLLGGGGVKLCLNPSNKEEIISIDVHDLARNVLTGNNWQTVCFVISTGSQNICTDFARGQ